MHDSHLFQKRVLSWFTEYGRHDLPWQNPQTPYRVWVSEIMLQQTQVKTVIGYFEKFMQSFPDIQTLASADINLVLHHWAGLGYYARARNLHRTARIIIETHGGKFPNTLESIMALPGIGRSTAGAILSLSMSIAQPILDGNVKRVLSRWAGIEGWSGNKAIENQLWTLSAQLTPVESVADYTQAMMDLGATVCTRNKPACLICPLNKDCVAHKQNLTHSIPSKRPKRAYPIKTSYFILLKYKNTVFLEQRKDSGIWSGLWCPIQIDTENEMKQFCQRYSDKAHIIKHPTCTHKFTHYQLDYQPIEITLQTQPTDLKGQWFTLATIQESVGLPAPIKKWLIKKQTALS